jgi:hypothetical protein
MLNRITYKVTSVTSEENKVKGKNLTTANRAYREEVMKLTMMTMAPIHEAVFGQETWRLLTLCTSLHQLFVHDTKNF